MIFFQTAHTCTKSSYKDWKQSLLEQSTGLCWWECVVYGSSVTMKSDSGSSVGVTD